MVVAAMAAPPPHGSTSAASRPASAPGAPGEPERGGPPAATIGADAEGANAPPGASALEVGGNSGANGLRSEGLSTAARQARWVLVTPAAAATCKDFQAARNLVSTLRKSWQPVWPTERPGAERLVEVLTARLSLDGEDRGQLLQDIGLANSKKTASCSWWPCRIAWS